MSEETTIQANETNHGEVAVGNILQRKANSMGRELTNSTAEENKAEKEIPETKPSVETTTVETKVVEEPTAAAEEIIEEKTPVATESQQEPITPSLKPEDVAKLVEEKLAAAQPAVAEPTEEEQLAALQKKIGYFEPTADDLAFLNDYDLDPAEKAKRFHQLQLRYQEVNFKAQQELLAQQVNPVQQQLEQQQREAAAAAQAQQVAAAQKVFNTTYPHLEQHSDLVDFAATRVVQKHGALPNTNPETIKHYMSLVAAEAEAINPSVKVASKSISSTPPTLSSNKNSGGTSKAAAVEEAPKSLTDNILARKKAKFGR